MSSFVAGYFLIQLVHKKFQSDHVTLLLVLGAAGVGFAARPLYYRIKSLIDSAFYPEHHQRNEKLSRLEQAILFQKDTLNLTQTLLEQLFSTFKVIKFSLFLRNEEDGAYQLQSSVGWGLQDAGGEVPTLEETNCIPTYLLENDYILLDKANERSAKGMKEDHPLETWMNKFQSTLCMPIKSDRLLGFFMLGEKESGLSYTQEEIQDLKDLASLTAMVTKNASLTKSHNDFSTVILSLENLTKSMQLNDTIAQALDILKSISGSDEAYIALTQPERTGATGREAEEGGHSSGLTFYPQGTQDRSVSPDAVYEVILNRRHELIPDLAGHPNRDLFPPHFSSCILYPIFSGEPGDEQRSVGAVVLAMADGKKFKKEQMHLLRRILELVGIFLNNVLIHSKAEENSSKDAMTDVYNHRKIKEYLADGIKSAQETKSPVSVILADIDNFKKINDTYGHPMGDEVIKSFAHLISRSTRTTGKTDQPLLTGRLGGEEFLIILKDTSLDGARIAAERIMRDTHHCKIRNEKGARIRFTVSMGVAEYPGDASNPVELIKKADAMMYRAKAAGRDRIFLANGEMVRPEFDLDPV